MWVPVDFVHESVGTALEAAGVDWSSSLFVSWHGVIPYMAAGMGKPWITFTTRAEFAALVADAGFDVIEDVGAADIEDRYGSRAVNFERTAIIRKPRL